MLGAELAAEGLGSWLAAAATGNEMLEAMAVTRLETDAGTGVGVADRTVEVMVGTYPDPMALLAAEESRTAGELALLERRVGGIDAPTAATSAVGGVIRAA